MKGKDLLVLKAEAELERNKRERKILLSKLKLVRAFSKTKVERDPAKLSPDETELVRTATAECLGEEYVLQPALSACTSNLFHEKFKPVEQLRRDNLARFRAQPKKKRGRPLGSEDWCAKEHIGKFADMWLEKYGEFPRQEAGPKDDKFGQFLKKIAKALNVGDGKGHHVTWTGIRKTVLREKSDDAQARSRSYLPVSLRLTSENLSTVFKNYYAVLSMLIEKKRIEEEISKIPGAEKIRKITWDDDRESK